MHKAVWGFLVSTSMGFGFWIIYHGSTKRLQPPSEHIQGVLYYRLRSLILKSETRDFTLLHGGYDFFQIFDDSFIREYSLRESPKLELLSYENTMIENNGYLSGMNHHQIFWSATPYILPFICKYDLLIYTNVAFEPNLIMELVLVSIAVSQV